MLLCIIALTVFVRAMYDKYQTGISELRKQLDPAFRQAINEELESRFGRCNEVFIYRKGENLTSGDAQLTSLSENNSPNKLPKGQVLLGSFEQQFKQYHLRQNHPICADSLNFYLTQIMKRMGIKVQTKVEIKNQETSKTQVSKSKRTDLVYPYASEVYLIDSNQQIQVQAFADFPTEMAFLYDGWPRFIRRTLFSMTCLLLAVLILCRRLIAKKVFNQEEEIPLIRILNQKEGLYQIADLVLSTRQQAIFYKKEKIRISARSMFLLETMILNEKHILPKDFAYTGFKNENVLSSENNLQVAIKRLRNILAVDPRVKINTLRNVGYQLTAE